MDIYEWIENKFTFHESNEEMVEKYRRIRSKAKELAYIIAECCPDDSDRHKALETLRDVVTQANSSIATEVREDDLK